MQSHEFKVPYEIHQIIKTVLKRVCWLDFSIMGTLLLSHITFLITLEESGPEKIYDNDRTTTLKFPCLVNIRQH